MAIITAEGDAVIYTYHIVLVEYNIGTDPGSLVQPLPIYLLSA
jgi:hypothetical protein